MKHVIINLLEVFNLRAFAINIRNRCKYLTNFRLLNRNARFRKKGIPDGLPLPPPQLVLLVTGHYDIEIFYRNGVLGSECIKDILEKNRLNINKFDYILDFGCGCGRIIRHWKTLRGPELYGSDYNPILIRWCQKALSFANFKLNKLASNLEYEDEKFDFIYAISVFTHLTRELQNFWISELRRVLKPSGFLFITTHGTTRLHQLSSEERERFESGQLVIRYNEYVGTNICGAYHPEQYVRQNLAKGFTIIDFIPGGAKDANQDVFLLMKTTR